MKNRVIFYPVVWRTGRDRVSRRLSAVLALGVVTVLTLDLISAQLPYVSPAFAVGGPIGAEFQINQTTTGNEREPEVAYDSTNDRYLAVWRHYNGSDNDVFAQIVNADGTATLAESVIANSSDYENYPDVAYNPDHDEYLVVYVQTITKTNKKGKPLKESYVVRGQRVDRNGADIGTPFDVSVLYSDTVTHSRVAYNTAAGNYLVVWQTDEKAGKGRKAPHGIIYGATVDANNNGISLGPIQTYAAGGYSTNCGDVDLAADNDVAGGRFLVIFPYCVEEAEVHGRLVDADDSGEPVGAGPFVIARESGVHLDAQGVAYGSNEYLVVFVRPGGGHQFKARRVSSSGTPQGADNKGFLVFEPTTEDGVTDGGMAVGYGAGSFLVTWSFDPVVDGDFDRHIYGREVMPGGAMLTGEFIISGSDGTNKRSPAVAFSTANGHFLVVWSDIPSDTANVPADIRGVRWDLSP